MKKKKLYNEAGEPIRVRCYMQKRNPTTDYITVVYTYINKAGYPPGTVLYRGMNDTPTHPQGFGMMGEAWRHSFNPGGSMVSFSDLPQECQEVVRQDYRDIWAFAMSDVVLTDREKDIADYMIHQNRAALNDISPRNDMRLIAVRQACKDTVKAIGRTEMKTYEPTTNEEWSRITCWITDVFYYRDER